MASIISGSAVITEAFPVEESNGSSQIDAFNNVDAPAEDFFPPREPTSNEAEEAVEFRRIKVIPNGSVVRIVMNNRNSKGKAAGYLGGDAVVVSSANNGMGGWHEVKTADGKLLKLQRNSLLIQQVSDNEQLEDVGPPVATAERGERRQRQKVSADEFDTDYGPSPKRLRRHNPQRGACTAEDGDHATAFAKISKDSVAKYARLYDIRTPSGDEGWPCLLERCCQHYSRQKPVESSELPGLLVSLHLALKRDRCQRKDPR